MAKPSAHLQNPTVSEMIQCMLADPAARLAAAEFAEMDMEPTQRQPDGEL
jgi:hypothetical protein